MAKIHQLQRSQKTSSNKANIAQGVKLPIFPRLFYWLKIKKVKNTKYTYDASWNAAYKIFTILRSVSKGVYIRDIGLYGMIKVQHQEFMQKNESLDFENEVA